MKITKLAVKSVLVAILLLSIILHYFSWYSSVSSRYYFGFVLYTDRNSINRKLEAKK